MSFPWRIRQPSTTLLWCMMLLLLDGPVLVLGQNAASSDSACQESCANAQCVQFNFTTCNVNCDNTGVTAIVGTCQSASFHDASSVSCTVGACRSVVLSDQTTATCTGQDSCADGTVRQSTATCTDYSCHGAHFYASAATCDNGACSDAAMPPCTCCDGYQCPFGTTSCVENTLGFCSSTYLGQNCKEWGNPACDVLTVAPTGKKVTVCENGNCQGRAFDDTGVLCENRNGIDTCLQANFSSSLVDCNAGACRDANFADSTVQCYSTLQGLGDSTANAAADSATTGSCNGATAVRSSMHCTRRTQPSPPHTLIDPVCANMDFYSSAVECGSGACLDSWYFRCSCCDGYGCPYGTPSCTVLPQEFCSTVYVGKTCKEWGNPACQDVVVDETGPDIAVTVCSHGNCRNSRYNDAAVLCDNADYFGAEGTCHGVEISNSAISCEAGACHVSTIAASNVTCQKARGGPSCLASTISQSMATCLDESCQGAIFVASAVSCAYGTCVDATMDACTCCDGDGCPYDSTELAVSCLGDLANFCATCAGQGNPLCKDGGSVSGPTTVVTTPTITTLIAPTAVPPSLAPVLLPLPTSSPSGVRGTSSPTTGSPLTDPNKNSLVIPSSKFNSTLLETASNTPIAIPLVSGDNETVTVVDTPKHGDVATLDNGTLTYIPDSDFEGEDSFDVQVCDANQECEITTLAVNVAVAVEVQQPPTPNSLQPPSVTSFADRKSSSSTSAVSWLAVLVLLPTGAIAWYVIRQYRANPPKSEESFETGGDRSQSPPTSLPVQDPIRLHNPNDALGEGGKDTGETNDATTTRGHYNPDTQVPPTVTLTTNESLVDESNQQRHYLVPPHHPGVIPNHKDQCRTVAPPPVTSYMAEASASEQQQPVIDAVQVVEVSSLSAELSESELVA